MWATPTVKKIQAVVREAVSGIIDGGSLRGVDPSPFDQRAEVLGENESPIAELVVHPGGEKYDTSFSLSQDPGIRIHLTQPRNKPEKKPVLSAVSIVKPEGTWTLGRSSIEHRSAGGDPYPHVIRRWQVEREDPSTAALTTFMVQLDPAGEMVMYSADASGQLIRREGSSRISRRDFQEFLTPETRELCGQEVGWGLNYPETAQWIAREARIAELAEKVKSFRLQPK